jgi:hypothetical protein
MDQPAVFHKIFPSASIYGWNEPVWVHPLRVAAMEYPVEPSGTVDQFKFTWAGWDIVGPTASVKLVRFRVGEVMNRFNQDRVWPTQRAVLVNAASVWAVQGCINGTRLYLSQTEPTLKPENGIFVLIVPESHNPGQPDSTPKAVAGALGIELADLP